MNKAEKFVIKDADGNYLCAQSAGFEKWCDWSTDLGDATLFNKKKYAEGAVLFYEANPKGFETVETKSGEIYGYLKKNLA